MIRLLILMLLTAPALARGPQPADIAFDQHLDETVPLDVSLRNEQGQAVQLARFFGNDPVILAFVYYQCPNLCGLTLEGLAESLQAVSLKAGQEFRTVIIGIDPEETSIQAAAKKDELKARFPDVGLEQGWHFLTGEEPEIRRLADRIGYRYAYDPDLGQYAHAAGIVVLTPQGRIARYFYGVRFPAQVLRLSLVEASAGGIGSPVDQLVLLCYDYDPETGRYSLVILKVLRLAGLVTMAAVGIGIGLMLLRERRRRLAGKELEEGG